MSLRDVWSRGAATVGIVTTLAGASHPAITGTSRELAKQYSGYSAKVRVPQTRRDMSRTLSASTVALNARKADSGLVTKKAIRRLR